MSKESGIEPTRILGYIWPPDLWVQQATQNAATTGDLTVAITAPKSRTKLWEIEDPPLLGILEPPSFGWTAGAATLNKFGRSKAQLCVETASTEDGLSVEDVALNCKHAAVAVNVNIVQTKTAEGNDVLTAVNGVSAGDDDG